MILHDNTELLKITSTTFQKIYLICSTSLLLRAGALSYKTSRVLRYSFGRMWLKETSPWPSLI